MSRISLGSIPIGTFPNPPYLTIHRLLSSATTLLTLLSNPLNVTLLTSQLLSAPTIWQRPDGLRTTIRILSIFNSAASHLIQSEDSPEVNRPFPRERGLGREEWAIAVVKGADDRSPRWRHLCALAGLLTGFERRGKQSISKSLRRKLESATVTAGNLALQAGEASDELAGNSICVMLSHAFDVLSDSEKSNLNNNLLLPILTHAPFFSKEGLQYGYFLSTIDSDVVQTEAIKFDWSPKSTTYVSCQRMATGPLIASLASLSRLTAFSVENVRNTDLLSGMIIDLSAFTRSLCVQWRQNKLSEIDVTEEPMYLSEESLKTTVPLLWRVLKSTMFAVVIVLRSLLGRVLSDNLISADAGKSLAIRRLLPLIDEIQLRSWRFRRSRSYGIYTSSPRDLELTPLHNIHSCFLLLSISCLNSHCKLRPFFRKFDHHQQAGYHSTLWIAVWISISLIQLNTLLQCLVLNSTKSFSSVQLLPT